MMMGRKWQRSAGGVLVPGGGIPTDGLVAWYTMDNISGSTLVDEMGNYDGTITGATQTVGVIDQSLSFDGTTSDEVNLGALGLTDATISLWVYLNTLAPVQQPIISNWASALLLSYIFDVYQGDYRWIKRSNSTTNYILSAPATAGLWQHLVFYSVDGDSGLIINNGTPITGPSNTDLRSTSVDVLLGRKGDDPVPRLNGKIDQLRIYNRALTAEEITSLYNEV